MTHEQDQHARLLREGARADWVIAVMAVAVLAAYLIVHWRN